VADTKGLPETRRTDAVEKRWEREGGFLLEKGRGDAAARLAETTQLLGAEQSEAAAKLSETVSLLEKERRDAAEKVGGDLQSDSAGKAEEHVGKKTISLILGFKYQCE
jgi:hypothetical protein